MDIVKRNELLLIISKYAKKNGEEDTSDPNRIFLRFDACSIHVRKAGGPISLDIRPKVFPVGYDIQEDGDPTYCRLVLRGTKMGLKEVNLERFVLEHEE
ncbi:hypothetical protein KY349_05050, partial [Candidatus Woesearchaeota archaeon]|nr:hypothetical protein [Candidatus Woesearchaeota archaeon]